MATRPKIFELHDLPGGLCTAWHRQGYVFDGCIHYIFGSGRGQPFYNVWEELGAVQDLEYVNHADFMQIRGPAGEVLNVHSYPDALEQHLTSISPEDARLIEGFCRGVRTFKDFDLSMLQQKAQVPDDGGRLGQGGERSAALYPGSGQMGQPVPAGASQSVQTSLFAAGGAPICSPGQTCR